MPFVPYGKKAPKRPPIERSVEDAIIERSVRAAWVAISDERLCLQMCVLLERILRMVLPSLTFGLRLGSVHVIPEDKTISPILFDPRGPRGIDGGFHAWLETPDGRLLDPSILITLDADGYAVDPNRILLVHGRSVVRDELRFVYEDLPDLEVVGVEESEPHLARLMALAMSGAPQAPGTIYLDVRWRAPSGAPDDGRA
ncbi:hypothetical protein EON82_24600 [bacterium]|nr:MAG: hypothetical protein EON82_24600 [bacterium]